MSSKEQARRNDKESAQQRPENSAIENLGIVAQQQTHPATIIERAKHDPMSLTPDDVGRLQRMIGNQAVGRLLAQTAQHQPIQRTSLVQRGFQARTRQSDPVPAILAKTTHVVQQNGGGGATRLGTEVDR